MNLRTKAVTPVAAWFPDEVTAETRSQREGINYFFLPADDLAAMAADFLLLALTAAVFFCVDFLFTDFGDLSPIIFIFIFCGLTRLWHDKFRRR